MNTTHTNLGQLIDQRRAVSAQLAGIELQIAMAVGDRDSARRHMAEMNAQTCARISSRQACETNNTNSVEIQS